MSLPMKNIILSPKSSLTPTFLGEILSPKVSKENSERESKPDRNFLGPSWEFLAAGFRV